ncbi:hypothetical protein M408DRAFT_23892 [Serendipita vermifera MAFF 305830]|uniref:Uncharacterized protein n=1 Tax=Serendipita vermifera MAFF 305830 TaxID=933852 RepID=A0A0C2XGE5_SERVB|nr:hypothetical protein M408DRAFT_23892 [Serendipita vermifera MAFF 305830]
MKLILGITGIASLIAQAIAQDIWCPPPTTKTSVYSFCPNSCMPPRSTYTTTAHPTITVQPPCPTYRPSPTSTPTPMPTSISATRMGKVVTSTCPPYVYETKSVTMPCSSCTYSVLPPLTITVTDQATVTTMLPCPSLTSTSVSQSITPTPKPTSSSSTKKDTSSTLSCSYGCSFSDGGITTTMSTLPTATSPPWKCAQWCEV